MDRRTSSDSENLAREAHQLMREWRVRREHQDDRIRSVTSDVGAALQRWRNDSVRSVEDEVFVNEELGRIVSTLTQLNELGRINNEKIVMRARDLTEATRLDAGGQMAFLVELCDEIHRVMDEDLPQRSSVLDAHEEAARRVESFIDYRLGPGTVDRRSKRFWRP